ncbi:MAG: tRNA (adenosine(37)-N6)-dimethylallyltransferase MiaA [Rhodospirillaceae bacterium]|nr:tRNA (adenosine(37)-N6)-dimethylallyltransferase MiaA [Rhodospirillaceae bacterium]
MLAEKPHRAVVIAGPTAGGKSALALALARACGGVIINADSQQRYRDLPILTARPNDAEMAAAPHRLFADLGPDDSSSAADWAARAEAEIRGVGDALPILVGGTGLYLRALTEGLAYIPPVPDDVRVATRALMDEIGNDAFHARLVARDPNAARLGAGDTQRNLRAYEVLESSGVSLWEWQRRGNTARFPLRTFNILVLPPRADVIAACDTRFNAMIAAGAVDEVRALLGGGVARDAPVMRILGAAQIADFLAGERTLDDAITLAQAATRQYAKRQSTWFRNQWEADVAVAEIFHDGARAAVVQKVREALLQSVDNWQN